MSAKSVKDVLVLFEGTHRLKWMRTGQAEWRLVGLWPWCEPDRGAGLLGDGQRILIVIDREAPTTMLLPEEARELPPGLIVNSELGAEVVDVEIPRFDWLPEREQERGEWFVKTAEITLRHTSSVVLPPLLLDEEPGEQVRFVHKTSRAPLADHALVDVVDHMFPA
jgi:hypothetical protein